MQAEFVHLRVHSAYSLAEGAVRIPELVKLCQEHNMPAVAVTDSANLFGALEFALAAAKGGVQPIVGCQLGRRGAQQLPGPRDRDQKADCPAVPLSGCQLENRCDRGTSPAHPMRESTTSRLRRASPCFRWTTTEIWSSSSSSSRRSFENVPWLWRPRAATMNLLGGRVRCSTTPNRSC